MKTKVLSEHSACLIICIAMMDVVSVDVCVCVCECNSVYV